MATNSTKKYKSPPSSWSTKDIPNLSGKIIFITGGTGGLGYEIALALAKSQATVVIGGRSEEKCKEAVGKIKESCPDADISFGLVDLADLESIADFAGDFNDKQEWLDILINNGGVFRPPKRQLTKQGFELQFGTNYLSHFALTAQLLPSLRKSMSPARVVTVCSSMANKAHINFEDLQTSVNYGQGWNAYGQSKLATLMFAFELERRSKEFGWGLQSFAAHPGLARTNIVRNGPGESSWYGKLYSSSIFQKVVTQSAADGALPILFAAVGTDAEGGAYYGPSGIMELKGHHVALAKIPHRAKDLEVAKKLWEVSEKLGSVQWE